MQTGIRVEECCGVGWLSTWEHADRCGNRGNHGAGLKVMVVDEKPTREGGKPMQVARVD